MTGKVFASVSLPANVHQILFPEKKTRHHILVLQILQSSEVYAQVASTYQLVPNSEDMDEVVKLFNQD